ncbi:MAG: 3-hydroxyacyl-CoA dehydrogenase NAD-binding domain-containing protein, partial [Proteobacteria bacterium]|nr:3-hydroxyacyl-CoA dehydrogenase NAD-binding domain-containing protein [Pseudomonadota bacterium]
MNQSLRSSTETPFRIKEVCVLGAGVMGAQIAALLADAGVKVFLLDLATETSTGPDGKPLKVDRNQRVLDALNALSKLK